MSESFQDNLQVLAEYPIEAEDDVDWLVISLATMEDLASRLRERLTQLRYWS
jgi:hypothetical protein